MENGEVRREPQYIRGSSQREPDFAVTSVTYDLEQLLPGLPFHRSEVDRLEHEGGAVDVPEGRKSLTLMAAEVPEDTFVGVDTQELA